MKHLKLFFALFALLALGVGNAWGAETLYKTALFGANYNSKKVSSYTDTWTATNNGFTVTVVNANNNNNGWAYIKMGRKSALSVGSITTQSAIDKPISKITMTIDAVTAKNIKSIKLKTSTNGSSFVEAGTFTISKGDQSVTINNPTANLYYQIEVDCNTGSNGSIQISKVQYYATEDAGSGGDEPVATLSATPTTIDFGTVYQGSTVADQTVTVNFENLTGNVTYSGLSTPFTATGTVSNDGDKITIKANTATIKEYSQTLTITSAADSKTAEVTVKMNVEAPFNGKKLGFDFVNHPTGWPVKSNATAGEYVYNLDDTDYTFKHSKSGDGVYVAGTSGTSGYLLIASGNTLGLPAIKGHKLVKVQGTLNNSGSPSTSASVSITDGTNTLSGGTAQTWNTKGGIYTYSLSETQANTMYYLSVSNKNLQMITLVLYYEECEKYALTITEPTEGGTLVVKDGENTLTSGAEIYEGTKLTVTATPETGYEDGVVVVKNASDEDITATVYADGVLTMPAYAVTISATFDKKPCELLAKPTVSATTTYSSATLTWEADANAAKYSVKVGTADAVETTETSYDVTGLNAETEYTYQVQAIAEADQDTYCDSEVAEGTFTTATAPTATLTLKDIVGTTILTGSLNGTITLPTEAAECSKTFVGWDADENCDHAPTYAPGAECTLAAETQTLYAVYADGEGGEPTWNRVTNLAALTSGGTFILGYEATAKSGKIIPMRTSGTATISAAGYMYSGNADGTTSNNATLDMASISESSKFEIVLEASSIVDGAVNIKLGDNYLGNTDTKNNCKLFTSASKNTAFTPTIGTNDVVKLTIKANNDYTTLQFNNNSGSYRYAVYGGAQKDVVFYKKEISSSYSNYSTTCAAAPIATVDPTSVTATVAGGNGKVEVTYENVNAANVAVALYNDEACTETFTAGWLTASIDADKYITYTVAENTTYAERKAYIQLTAPETTGAVDPAVVVIPVTQAAKEKVFASLAELLANITPTADATKVTVTLTKEPIVDIYVSGNYRNGIFLNVPYQGTTKEIEIYSRDVPAEWVAGGSVSGTLTNCDWKVYNGTWELCPADWSELTYQEPKAVSTVVVSGAPTKTTYVDGEAFDPAGLTVTVNYNDATTEVNPTGVTFEVTPATLTKGETFVSVTATYNTVSSAPYEVTGLTVNDIPTKTVAEFIAAGGTRCYLEGIVSGLTEGNSMKYGNFDLTDASGTIYVYGCLNASGEKEKFAELGVKNGDKIKVIADELTVYNSKDQAKDVQYVSHKSAATIEVSNITMEVGQEKAIEATITPDAAQSTVQYAITSGSEYINLDGTTITAVAAGEATITATVAEVAGEYYGTTKTFTVTVKPQNIAILPFTFNGGKADIENTLGMAQNGLGSDYSASTAPNSQLKFDGSGDWLVIHFDSEPGQLSYDIKNNSFSGGTFSVQESADGETYTDVKVHTEITETQNEMHTLLSTSRYVKFIYIEKKNGNVGLGNITISGALPTYTLTLVSNPDEIGATLTGAGTYKGTQDVTVTASHTDADWVFAYWTLDEEVVSYDAEYTFRLGADMELVANFEQTTPAPTPDYTRSVTAGNYGTICLEFGATKIEGAELYEVVSKENGGVWLASVTELVAGTPYIFRATATELAVYSDGTTATEAGSANGLIGNFTNEFVVPTGNYILYKNTFIPADGATNKLNANRAYLDLDAVQEGTPVQMPGRRYIGMSVQGENGTTGLDNIAAPEGQLIKTIENGQLIIIRNGEKYNVQGQKL